MKPKRTLYLSVRAAGIETASHESDLYIPATPEAVAILAGYPLQKANATRFRNQVDGKIWIDVPFAFDPYWEARGMSRS